MSTRLPFWVTCVFLALLSGSSSLPDMSPIMFSPSICLRRNIWLGLVLEGGTVKNIIKIIPVSMIELYEFYRRSMCCPKQPHIIAGDATKRTFPTNRVKQRVQNPWISVCFWCVGEETEGQHVFNWVVSTPKWQNETIKHRISLCFLPDQHILSVIAVIVVSEYLINYNSKRWLL